MDHELSSKEEVMAQTKHPILLMTRGARNAELRRLARQSDELLEMAYAAIRANLHGTADAFVNLADELNTFKPAGVSMTAVVAGLAPQSFSNAS